MAKASLSLTTDTGRVAVMDAQIDAYLPEAGSVTLLTTSWCGYCRRLKYQLDRDEVAYTETDIEQDPRAADVVTSVNNGNRTVPTVIFPDGSTATNPSVREITTRLDAKAADCRTSPRRAAERSRIPDSAGTLPQR